MRRIAATFIAVMVLCWTATPLLACVIPGWAMTLQERECCKHMPQMCGSAQMPASHTCCKTQVRSSNPPVVTRVQQSSPVLPVVAFVSVVGLPQISGQFNERVQHHPPSESPPEPTVLRI